MDFVSLTMTVSYTHTLIYTLQAALAPTEPMWFHSSDIKGYFFFKVVLEMRKQKHRKVENLTQDPTGR